MTKIEYENSVERRLRTELRLRLGWPGISMSGKVFCWSKHNEIVVVIYYLKKNVGISVNERFTFPANTPADEVVCHILLQLTFL